MVLGKSASIKIVFIAFAAKSAQLRWCKALAGRKEDRNAFLFHSAGLEDRQGWSCQVPGRALHDFCGTMHVVLEKCYNQVIRCRQEKVGSTMFNGGGSRVTRILFHEDFVPVQLYHMLSGAMAVEATRPKCSTLIFLCLTLGWTHAGVRAGSALHERNGKRRF